MLLRPWLINRKNWEHDKGTKTLQMNVSIMYLCWAIKHHGCNKTYVYVALNFFLNGGGTRNVQLLFILPLYTIKHILLSSMLDFFALRDCSKLDQLHMPWYLADHCYMLSLASWARRCALSMTADCVRHGN